MKLLTALVLLALSQNAGAQALKTYAGDLFKGQELVNEHPTGKACYVVIQQTFSMQEKGNHCHGLEAQFAFDNKAVSKDPVTLQSRVTNYHRSEYPKVKSCAANLDGGTADNQIYGTDTENIYVPFFAAMNKVGTTQYDYFLTIDPDTKQPSRARVHVMKLFSEVNYDCVNLRSPEEALPVSSGHTHGVGTSHDHGHQPPTTKPQGCDLYFADHKICGRIYFDSKPLVAKASSFKVLFTNRNNEAVDHEPVFVDLWMNMGSHGGHGSAPVKIERLQTGLYQVSDAYFVMEGTWQVRVTIGDKTHHAEQSIYQVTIK